MQNTDDLNPVFTGPVEHQVLLEAPDRKHPNIFQKWSPEIPQGTHLRHVCEYGETMLSRNQESVGCVRSVFSNVQRLLNHVQSG